VNRCPGSHIQDAVIIGVQIIIDCAGETTDENVRDIVAVLEIQLVECSVQHEINTTAGEGECILGDEEEAVTGHSVAGQVNNALNHATETCV